MSEQDYGLPWYWWAIFGAVVLLVVGKLNRSSASHPVNALGACNKKVNTPPVLGTSSGQPACAVVAGVCEVDYSGCLGCWTPSECGKAVKLGGKFFSSKVGVTMLPGTAGTYFSAAQLANPGTNPWKLNVNSKISNAQWTQMNEFFHMKPPTPTSSVAACMFHIAAPPPIAVQSNPIRVSVPTAGTPNKPVNTTARRVL